MTREGHPNRPLSCACLSRIHTHSLSHSLTLAGPCPQVHDLMLELARVKQEVIMRRLADAAEFRAATDDVMWRDLQSQVSRLGGLQVQRVVHSSLGALWP